MRRELFSDIHTLVARRTLNVQRAPFYFYEMVGLVGAQGLSYLAQPCPEAMFPSPCGPR